VRPHYIIPNDSYASLDNYRQEKGDALAAARKLSAQEIIVELKAAGLRGRGGGGFPTGTKWFTLFQHPCKVKYVVINAAEGEPGTFKDRYVLRKNPYAVIEGALIASHVLKARHVYLAIKKTFKQEIRRLQQVLKEFKQHNLLQGVTFHIVAGPEDYLFGEEKALLNVIEGIGPFPREAHYPPYEKGLFSTPISPNPALVNNVETFARVPEIILRGAESFRSIGTDDTPGPIICTLTGDIKSPGVYEVDPKITLGELLNELGHGPPPGRQFKAILSGVANAVMTNQHLTIPLEFSAMAQAGGGLGSAGFIIYDDTRSMPRVAQEVAKFLYKESCNQCTACKTGLALASVSIDGLFTDNPDANLVDRAVIGAKSAPQSNRCYLPVQGSILIPSLTSVFSQEFTQLLGPQKKFTEKVQLPIIENFDESTRRFSYKGENTHDRPYSEDWHAGDMLDRGTY
jgi:NADH-quinone oxidoreductase subunit F